MKAFFKNRLNRGALRIVRGSLLSSTLIFLLYQAYPLDSMLGIGISFVVLFITIQVLLVATLFLNMLINYRDYEENMTTLIIAIVTIAIACLYLYLHLNTNS